MSFRSKLQTLLILLVGASCGLLLWLSLRKANQLAFELIQEKVFSVVVSAAPYVDGDAVASLREAGQDGSAGYLELAQSLREVRDANGTGAIPIRFVYIIRPLPDGRWEYVVDAEEEGPDRSALGDSVEFRHEREVPAFGVASVDHRYAKDSFGIWLSAFAPILDAEGEPVAMLAADIAAERIQLLLRQLLLGDLVAMLIALGLASALAAWLSRKVTRPLTELQRFVRGIGRGDFSSRIALKSNDEFGELATAINQMAEGLEERESLKGALVRYVRPKGREADGGQTEAAAGGAPRRVTALVAELVGFGDLAAELDGDEVFAVLNDYFPTMIDIVLRHRGSLEKSGDETVIAIFGAKGDDPHQERLAIQAALEMDRALEALLAAKGLKPAAPVRLASGIHSGLAKIVLKESSEQLDFASAHAIVESAAAVLAAGMRLRSPMTVSEETAKGLHGTFPLDEASDEAFDRPLFRVEMPQLKKSGQ